MTKESPHVPGASKAAVFVLDTEISRISPFETKARMSFAKHVFGKIPPFRGYLEGRPLH